MDELKFHFRQLVPVIFTLLDGEKHVAAASVNVVDSSAEKLNTASARGLAVRHGVGLRVRGAEKLVKTARSHADQRLSKRLWARCELPGAVASEKRRITETNNIPASERP